jgi:hypothetical protein
MKDGEGARLRHRIRSLTRREGLVGDGVPAHHGIFSAGIWRQAASVAGDSAWHGQGGKADQDNNAQEAADSAS